MPIFFLSMTKVVWYVQLKMSDLNLVYACTKDRTLMIELQATCTILEKDVEAGLRLAHPEV